MGTRIWDADTTRKTVQQAAWQPDLDVGMAVELTQNALGPFPPATMTLLPRQLLNETTPHEHHDVVQSQTGSGLTSVTYVSSNSPVYSRHPRTHNAFDQFPLYRTFMPRLCKLQSSFRKVNYCVYDLPSR